MPTTAVDTIETEINRFFDQVVACVDYRRRELLAEANEKREEKRDNLARKERSEQQLLTLKTDTELKLKENILKETQEKIMEEIEEKLAEVRIPSSRDTSDVLW